jgi:hypothetical protein
MSTSTDTALAVVEQQAGEIAPSIQTAMAKFEVEGAIVISRRFPRNEDAAFGRVMKSCSRFSFAALARYSYPRGGQQIEGPSVNLAREIARCWGNIRYGCDVVHDDEESRTVRGWAWDVETNTKETQDATFAKLVYRKKGGWQKPDERDLRELTNKHGAICVRNCLLHLVPPDLVDEALRNAKRTMEADTAKNPDEARRKTIVAFQGLGVSVEELEAYLGHALKQTSPAEMADLRAVWKSISDGNATWGEYVKDKLPTQPKPETGATVEDLANRQEEHSSDATRDARKAASAGGGAVAGAPAVSTPDPLAADELLGEFRDLINACATDGGIAEVLAKLDADQVLTPEQQSRVRARAALRKIILRADATKGGAKQ